MLMTIDKCRRVADEFNEPLILSREFLAYVFGGYLTQERSTQKARQRPKRAIGPDECRNGFGSRKGVDRASDSDATRDQRSAIHGASRKQRVRSQEH